jgi:hypothetical protein
VDRLAIEQYLAAIRGQELDQRLAERGLSRAGLTDQT